MIVITYPVIGLPPLSGAVHVTMTLSGDHEVLGESGYAGTWAVSIDTKLD